MKNTFYGWYVVAALFVIGLVASCTRYIFPVFLPSLVREFGWSRTAIGTALTVNFWVAAASAPLVGILIDRLGGRLVTAVGGVFLLSALVLLSTVESISQVYIYYSLCPVMLVHFLNAICKTSRTINPYPKFIKTLIATRGCLLCCITKPSQQWPHTRHGKVSRKSTSIFNIKYYLSSTTDA